MTDFRDIHGQEKNLRNIIDKAGSIVEVVEAVSKGFKDLEHRETKDHFARGMDNYYDSTTSLVNEKINGDAGKPADDEIIGDHVETLRDVVEQVSYDLLTHLGMGAHVEKLKNIGNDERRRTEIYRLVDKKMGLSGTQLSMQGLMESLATNEYAGKSMAEFYEEIEKRAGAAKEQGPKAIKDRIFQRINSKYDDDEMYEVMEELHAHLQEKKGLKIKDKERWVVENSPANASSIYHMNEQGSLNKQLAKRIGIELPEYEPAPSPN